MGVFIAIGMVCVLLALGSAGFFMLRKDREGDGGDGGDAAGRRDKRMARALAVRVGLSVALFIAVLFSYLMGWIQPTGIPVGL
jgi:Protein of unknown function (DUF2909)